MQLEIPSFHSLADEISSSSPINNMSFPAHIYAVLENSKSNGIIGWMPNGKEFKIHDMDRFEMEIIPSYFNNRKFLLSLHTYIQTLL